MGKTNKKDKINIIKSIGKKAIVGGVLSLAPLFYTQSALANSKVVKTPSEELFFVEASPRGAIDSVTDMNYNDREEFNKCALESGYMKPRDRNKAFMFFDRYGLNKIPNAKKGESYIIEFPFHDGKCEAPVHIRTSTKVNYDEPVLEKRIINIYIPSKNFNGPTSINKNWKNSIVEKGKVVQYPAVYPADLDNDGMCDTVLYNPKTNSFYAEIKGNEKIPLTLEDVIGKITDYMLGENYFTHKNQYNNFYFLEKECSESNMIKFVDKYNNKLKNPISDENKVRLYTNGVFLENLEDLIYNNVEEVKDINGKNYYKFSNKLPKLLESASNKLGIKDSSSWDVLKGWVFLPAALSQLQDYTDIKPNPTAVALYVRKILDRLGITGFNKNGKAYDLDFDGSRIYESNKVNFKNFGPLLEEFYKKYVFNPKAKY